MEEQEIREAFKEAINKRGVGKAAGLSKFQVYNHRHNRPEPSLGTMLEILWRLDKIEFKL